MGKYDVQEKLIDDAAKQIGPMLKTVYEQAKLLDSIYNELKPQLSVIEKEISSNSIGFDPREYGAYEDASDIFESLGDFLNNIELYSVEKVIKDLNDLAGDVVSDAEVNEEEEAE